MLSVGSRARRFSPSQNIHIIKWAPTDTVMYITDNRPSTSSRSRPRAGLPSHGVRALLSRALALANAEVPWLRSVHVNTDGSFQGLDELGAQVDPDEIFDGCVVLLAQLLGLLVAFIGELLTLRLVRDVWPKLPLNDLDFGKVEK